MKYEYDTSYSSLTNKMETSLFGEAGLKEVQVILDVCSHDSSDPSIGGHREAERLNSEILRTVARLVGRLARSHGVIPGY